MVAQFPQTAQIFRAVTQPYVTSTMIARPTDVRSGAAPLVLCIARLTAQKRLDRLLRAFTHVRTKNARLLILGEGEDRESLTTLVRELGLNDRVSMPGYLPDVTRALHEADLFVLTSDYEGLPAAVLEAMAANCPVLSTNCFPSAASLVGESPGCAIIVNTEPEALARQIEEMLRKERPASLVQIAKRYSVTNGVEKHVEAILDVLERP